MKKYISCAFKIILLICCMCVPVWADTQKASEVKIDGLQQGERFRVWKVVDINYNLTTNSYAMVFNSNFADYFAGKSVTIETFRNYTDNSNDIYNILSGLPAYISNASSNASSPLTKYDDFIVGADGSHTLTNVPAGGYFIEPVGTERIYQTMFIPVVPTIEDSGYVVNKVTFTAKHSDVEIDKKVSNDGISFYDFVDAAVNSVDAANSIVTYKIRIGVPKYVSPVSANTVMKVDDTIPAGLSFIDDSLKCAGIDEISTSHDIDSVYYSFTSNNLTVDFSGDRYTYISSQNYKYIDIEYKCELTNPAAYNSGNSIRNIAKYTYSKYPYTSGSTKEKSDEADVKTYAATITKQDSADDSIKLNGAEFDLYRQAQGSETHDKTITEGSNTIYLRRISGPYATDSNGNFSINGLKHGDYYLVETKAPHGYAHDGAPVKLTIEETQTENATLAINNTKALLTLPTTGSSGMMIFTVAGIVLMMSAIVIIIVFSRKGNKVQK